nr:serine/threonine protein kinase [candidate division Zixibacteria bacterium]
MTAEGLTPGNYIIDRILGSGGTARVHLARKKNNNRPLAFKTILNNIPEDINQFIALINRENSLIGGLSYPGLVRIMEINTENSSTPYIILEYCPGLTLDVIPIIDDHHIFLNVLSALSINLYYLRLAGIYHGDIKPQNIFLTGRIDDYAGSTLRYTKISDFSLARRDTENKDSRLGIGTVGYMAPETIDSGILDHRSDLFACGVVAYQLATGQHPFLNHETDPVRINAAVKEQEPPEPNRIRPNLDKAISNTIMTLLHKSPKFRPTDGYSLCEYLEKLGATFPFRKCIRPKHILEIMAGKTTNEILASAPLTMDAPIRETLLEYCGNQQSRLRNILEINFQMGRLQWSNGKLGFSCPPAGIIFPNRLRKLDRIRFHSLPYSRKKKIVLTALTGDIPRAMSIGIISEKDVTEFVTRPLLNYARHGLSDTTVRRFAGKLADYALETYLDDILAAGLFIKAGNIERGFSVTIDAANKLINDNKNDQALELLQSMADLCRLENDREHLARILMEIGDIEKMIGDTDRAGKTYYEIINLYKNLPPDRLLAETYKDLGDLYKLKRDYARGIEALLEAKKIYGTLDDQLELSHTLNNMGNIYTISSQFRKALKSYFAALKIQRRLDAKADMASTLNNIGSVCYFQGRLKRSSRLLEQTLELLRRIGNAIEIARTLNNLGYVLYELGECDRALEYLNESSQLNRKIGSKKELLFNLENLTLVMLGAGQLKESIAYIKEALSLADDLNDEQMTAVFLTSMAVAQMKMGFYGRAYQNFQKAVGIYEKIDDSNSYITCLVELAGLFFKLNQREQASQFAYKGKNLAEKSGNKKGVIQTNLILGEIAGDIEILKESLNLAVPLHSPITTNQIMLRLAASYLQKGEIENARNTLEQLSEYFGDGHSNLDNANYYNMWGKISGSLNNGTEARRYFEKAIRLASDSHLILEKIDALSALGKLCFENRDFEESYRFYKEAVGSIRTIAADIKEERYRRTFLENECIIYVSTAVKKLGEILSQKKKADQ